MVKRRVGRHLSGGEEPEEERASRERSESLREAFSRWATGVTLAAARSGGRVHALTVSGFLPVSLDPPLVVISLGGNASILPYLEPGAGFAISLLTADQKGLSSRYADTFPVGPSPFTAEGPPIVSGALAALVCEVEELLERGDHTLVLARVTDASAGPPDAALIYYRRDYHRVG